MSWPATVRHRAVLAVAGHPAVDQARIARERDVGAEAEALHDAGPEALDQARRRSRSAAAPISRPSRLQVGATDRRPRFIAFHGRGRAAAAAGAVDPDDVGTEVGQQHRAERAGADAADLDDAHAAQRASCVPASL